MSYPKLTPVIAKEATEPRYLEDRFADKINVKDFGAVGDGVANDRDAFYEALKLFFNNPTKYKVLDLNGYNIGLKSNIKIRFGTEDFPTMQSSYQDSNGTWRGSEAREMCICNGMLTWLGKEPDTTNFLIDIGTNSGHTSELVDFKFHNVTFNGNQQTKNLVKVNNFYDLYFSECVFAQFDDGVTEASAVAVELGGFDDNKRYIDCNGATFWNCRWYDIDNPDLIVNGTPIRSYCGDLVVSGGFAEWCGPFDFHIGSILFESFHWSYGPIPSKTNLSRLAIFRDPREIQIHGCDIDQGTFLFTTEGFFEEQLEYNGSHSTGLYTGIPAQNAASNWSQISIKNNKFMANKRPENGEGFVNFKISNLKTTLQGISITGNVANAYIREQNSGVDNAVPFFKVINANATYINYLANPGNYSNEDDNPDNNIPVLISSIHAVYQYVDGWGMTPGSSYFGKNAFQLSNVNVFYSDGTIADAPTVSAHEITAPWIGTVNEAVLSGKLRVGYGCFVDTNANYGIKIQTNNTDRWQIHANGDFYPMASGVYNIGSGDNRVSNIFLSDQASSESDERVKDNIKQLTDDVFRAWSKVNFKVFQFKNAIAKKGVSEARLHVGVIAQEIQDAFESEGLDAFRYGLLCYDEWEDEYRDVEIIDKEAVFDSSGKEVEPAETHTESRLVKHAGNRYSIRYGEALALECAYQRWRLEQLEEPINQLTNLNN